MLFNTAFLNTARAGGKTAVERDALAVMSAVALSSVSEGSAPTVIASLIVLFIRASAAIQSRWFVARQLSVFEE